jgi:hypothetical protein
MAGHQGIAAVSVSLRRLLRDRMRETAQVTIAPPDIQIASTTSAAAPRLNLYLYRVAEHSTMRNVDIPGSGAPGRHRRPPLIVVLNYLVTAHAPNEQAEDADLQAQIILGDAMRVLHDYSTLTTGITVQRSSVGTVGEPILDIALRDELELLKISMHAMSIDDETRLWSALPDASFRRSAAYEVSCLEIESRLTSAGGPPVTTRRITLMPFAAAELTAVERAGAPGDVRVPVGGSLVARGNRLASGRTWVRLGTLRPMLSDPQDDETIEIVVPDGEYPVDAEHPTADPITAAERLEPGPQIVEVLTETRADVIAGAFDRGTSTATVQRVRSNQAVFMLVPGVTGVQPTSGPAGTTVTVNGARLRTGGDESAVLFGDVRAPVAAAVPPAAVSSESVQVEVPSLPPGRYPVRVLVNGALSVDGVSFEVTP